MLNEAGSSINAPLSGQKPCGASVKDGAVGSAADASGAPVSGQKAGGVCSGSVPGTRASIGAAAGGPVASGASAKGALSHSVGFSAAGPKSGPATTRIQANKAVSTPETSTGARVRAPIAAGARAKTGMPGVKQ